MRPNRVGLAAALCVSITGHPTSSTAQDCTSSPAGRYSFTTRPSPATVCRRVSDELRLYADAGCDPARLVATTEVGAGRNVRVTDAGVLVSLLAARTRRRDWDIVRLTLVDREGAARYVSLTLDDLPGTSTLFGTVRVEFEAGDVLFSDRARTVRLPFTALDALVSAR